MQYKVPQHVDIEDKVIGSLTIRQFVIVLIGVSVIGLLRVLLVGPLEILFWPIAFIFGAAVGALAFAKYGDQNMEVFLLSAVKTFISPRKRVWQNEAYNPEEHKEAPVVKEPEAPKDVRVNVTAAQDNLEKLAEVVDSGGYSIFDEGERANNFNAPKNEGLSTPDILEQAELGSREVDNMLEEATRVAPKREELVSEAASVVPDKSQAETPSIKLRKDQFYKEIR
jgi:hypothetical protein